MANSNAAYDLNSLPVGYNQTGAVKVKQPPELKVVVNRRARDRAMMVKLVAVFMIVIAVISAMLYNQMMLTELTSQVEMKQAQFEDLKNEGRRMQVELEGKTSLRAVADIAQYELGMAKAENYQIEYVDLSAGDRVMLAKESEPTLGDKIKEGLLSVWEYLGF